jgi:hypothetical protein
MEAWHRRQSVSLIELVESSLELIDGQQIIVDDHALGRLGPFEAVDPSSVGPCPVAPAVVQTATQEQLAQPMTTSLEIFTRIIAGATQVADGFLFRRRRPDLRQESRAQQLGELPGVAAIRFDPLAGFARDECRRDDLAESRAASSSAVATHTRRAQLRNTHAPAPAPRARASAPSAAPHSARSAPST